MHLNQKAVYIKKEKKKKLKTSFVFQRVGLFTKFVVPSSLTRVYHGFASRECMAVDRSRVNSTVTMYLYVQL